MTEQELFTVVGIRPEPTAQPVRKKQTGFPRISVILLLLIGAGCLAAGWISGKDPGYLYLDHCNEAPGREFWFGTDTLGRDIFSGIWYGGRVSLTVGFLATLISTGVAVVYGSVSGVAPRWLDGLLMRFTEIILSIPSLLLVLFLQAILGQANVLSLSVVIGFTGWAGIAKIIRTEVRQIRDREYVMASRCMGGNFFHILRRHLMPNFVASVMFMVVMNVQSAIAAESTLSFLGMGLPLETISWGSMLSLAQNALMSGSWWMIVIPGVFLVTLMMCLTNLGNHLRKCANRKERVL